MEPQRTDSTSVASTPAVASTTREASSPNCLAPGPIARDDAQPPAVPDPSQSRSRADSRAVDTVQTIDGGGTPPPHHSRKLGAVDQPLRLRTSALGLVDCENSPIDGSDQLRPDPASLQRRLGTTKFFNASKGFGFILDREPQELGNAEVFVHYTAIKSVQGGARAFKSLLEGEEVSYYVTQGPKGWQAQDVTGPSGKSLSSVRGPCIGTTPSSAPSRGLYALPKSLPHSSSHPDLRDGGKQNRFDRRSSGMVGPPNAQYGPRSGARRTSDQRMMNMASPRENHSNISSPPSQASSQLPATPQTPHYYPLPSSTLMYPGMPPLYFAHDLAHATAYYSPPPIVHAGSYYPASPLDGMHPPLPLLVSAYPPPVPPLEMNTPGAHIGRFPGAHDMNSPYPISSSQQNPAHSKPITMIDSSPVPNPYTDMYGATDELRPSYGYPISSRAS